VVSRKLLLALLMAGVSVSTAHAQAYEDDFPKTGWRPVFVVHVPDSKMKAAFPKGATVTGRAVLGCVAAKDGKLVDCKVVREIPSGQGFGEAALSVVGYERIKTKDEAGASVEGRPVRTGFEFLAPGDANPDWIRKPDGRDLANVFPKKALEKRVGGRATIQCRVTVEGFLDACKVVSESPAGMDFGAAGLQLAPQFRMSPKIRGGHAVPGGEVTIPINWEPPRGIAPISSTPIVLDPPWNRVPTQAEVSAAWPKAATGQPSGQVALRCDLVKTGQLRSCEVISETPRGKGFGKAAVELSKLFQINVNPSEAKTVSDYKVDLPFRFRDPAAPDARKLTKPRWIRTLTADGMAEVYPQAAAKAGVKSGLGVVSCTVTATGELTACQAVREQPANLDFGAAAIKAVSMMRMNPWTKEGDTVDGLVITIPIAFTWDDSVAPAEPAKPESPSKPR
jgi:TonB family protein